MKTAFSIRSKGWQRTMMAGAFSMLVLAGYLGFYEETFNFDIRNVEFATPMTTEQLSEVKQLMQRSAGHYRHIEDIRTSLDALPWVRSSHVKWMWPDRISVTVVSHEAVARWNDGGYLDSNGDAFTSRHVDGRFLPLLYGPKATERLVMWQYQQLTKRLLRFDQTIERLVLADTGSWKFELANGITVRLGSSEIYARIQRLTQILDLIVDSPEPVESVDLRYANGFSVGWKRCTYECNDLAFDTNL